MKKLCLVLLMSVSVFASVARIAAVRGEAVIIRANEEIKASVNLELENKDIIKTASKARVQVIFNDYTITTLGRNSEFVIDEFKLANKDSVMKLAVPKGSFKIISGEISKLARDNFSLRASTATIGIRGTVFVGEINKDISKVACLSGAINVRQGKSEKLVPAGKQIDFSHKSLGEIKPVKTNEFSQTQTEVISAEESHTIETSAQNTSSRALEHNHTNLNEQAKESKAEIKEEIKEPKADEVAEPKIIKESKEEPKIIEAIKPESQPKKIAPMIALSDDGKNPKPEYKPKKVAPIIALSDDGKEPKPEYKPTKIAPMITLSDDGQNPKAEYKPKKIAPMIALSEDGQNPKPEYKPKKVAPIIALSDDGKEPKPEYKPTKIAPMITLSDDGQNPKAEYKPKKIAPMIALSEDGKNALPQYEPKHLGWQEQELKSIIDDVKLKSQDSSNVIYLQTSNGLSHGFMGDKGDKSTFGFVILDQDKLISCVANKDGSYLLKKLDFVSNKTFSQLLDAKDLKFSKLNDRDGFSVEIDKTTYVFGDKQGQISAHESAMNKLFDEEKSYLQRAAYAKDHFIHPLEKNRKFYYKGENQALKFTPDTFGYDYIKMAPYYKGAKGLRIEVTRKDFDDGSHKLFIDAHDYFSNGEESQGTKSDRHYEIAKLSGEDSFNGNDAIKLDGKVIKVGGFYTDVAYKGSTKYSLEATKDHFTSEITTRYWPNANPVPLKYVIDLKAGDEADYESIKNIWEDIVTKGLADAQGVFDKYKVIRKDFEPGDPFEIASREDFYFSNPEHGEIRLNMGQNSHEFYGYATSFAGSAGMLGVKMYENENQQKLVNAKFISKDNDGKVLKLNEAFLHTNWDHSPSGVKISEKGVGINNPDRFNFEAKGGQNAINAQVDVAFKAEGEVAHTGKHEYTRINDSSRFDNTKAEFENAYKNDEPNFDALKPVEQ